MEEKYIFRTKVEKEFTIIRNSLLADKTLSWEARGLLAYLITKPDTWVVRKSDLISMSSAGNKKVMSILKELEVKGYIKRSKFRNKKGQWMWHTWVYDIPQPPPILPKRGHGETILPKTVRGSTACGLGSHIVSTDSQKTDSQKTEEKNIYENDDLRLAYEKKIGKLKPGQVKGFLKWNEVYPESWIMDAIDRAVQYNKKSFGYIQAILKNWKAHGRNGAKLSPESVDYLEDVFAEFIEE